MPFVRFVVGHDGDDHRQLTGVFTEARLMRDDGLLSEAETELLEATYAWFNDNVPVPPFEASGWSRDAVAWFKDDATSVEQIWHLVALLREHGQNVRMLRSRNPGKLLYEDDHQVVVEEWQEL